MQRLERPVDLTGEVGGHRRRKCGEGGDDGRIVRVACASDRRASGLRFDADQTGYM